MKLISWDRNRILRRYKISKKKGEAYRIVLQKAYYTYINSDAEFKEKMQEIMDFHDSIEELINEKSILPILDTDPIKLNEVNFEEYYQQLINCGKMLRNPDSPDSEKFDRIEGRRELIESFQ